MLYIANSSYFKIKPPWRRKLLAGGDQREPTGDCHFKIKATQVAIVKKYRNIATCVAFVTTFLVSVGSFVTYG